MNWVLNNKDSEKPEACEIVLAKLKYFPIYSNPYITLQWGQGKWWNDVFDVKYDDTMIEKFVIVD